MRTLRLILALLCVSLVAQAHHGRGAAGPGSPDPTANLIPSYNDVYANWKNAGLLSVGGIAAIDATRTACSQVVSPSGKTPPQSGDDDALIDAAITACASGTILTLGTSACTCSAPCVFELDQSEYAALNKSITVRGYGGYAGHCSSVNSVGTWWPVNINTYNGALLDWAISSTTAGSNCGVSTASVIACSQAAGTVLMSPSSNYAWGWAGSPLGPYNPTTGNFGTTLTADAAQGATTVSVASTANFSVGMWVLIDESPQVVSTTNPTGGSAVEASPEWLTTSAGAVALIEGGDIPGGYSFIGSGGGGQENQRLNQEIHQIASIGSGTLTFTTPLTLAFRQSGSHDARVYWPTQNNSTPNAFLFQAGLEDLAIIKAANSGVQIQFCAECWVQHVEVSTWIAGAVNCNYSARCDIESNYFHLGADLENNGNEYPIGISAASTEFYVADNIIQFGGKGMVERGAGAGVIAYNYVDDEMYMQAVIGDYWRDMSVNGSHYAGAHHALFEGNWGDSCDSDETHGNATYHVFYRNDCTGIRTTFVDPSQGKTANDTAGTCWGSGGGASPPATTCGPRRAAGPMGFDYRFAYVGNVLGLAGVTTTANGWVYQGAYSGSSGCPSLAQDKAIWMSGWTGSEWPACDPNLSATITSTENPYEFRNCDFDYVHGSQYDCATGYSHTLTNSFYIASAPSFFSGGASCTYPWPWVDPTTSPYVKTNSCSGSGLPAQARWNAGTPFAQP